MKRKLLDGSLIVFGAAALVRIVVAFAPHGFHLPRLLSEDANAAMVMSAALAISLGLSILAPHIKWPRLSRDHIITAATIVGLVLSIFVGVLMLAHNTKPTDNVPQVIWDDQKK